MFIQKKSRRVLANDDAGSVDIAPEATDLLFEAEDVAELVAEVTGEAVEVVADEDTVTFTIGEDEFTVEAEGNEEIVEARRTELRGKKPVSASTKRTATKSTKSIRKFPSKK